MDKGKLRELFKSETGLDYALQYIDYRVWLENKYLSTIAQQRLTDSEDKSSTSKCNHIFITKYGVSECQNCGIEESKCVK